MHLDSAPQKKADPVGKLVFELSKLPGIGEKTATRLAYYILKQKGEYPEALATAILGASQKTVLCEICFTLTAETPCLLCSDPKRDQSTLCVVEKPSDIFSIEKSLAHRGTYHVLHGVLSPLDGVGPENLKIRELLERLKGQITEVILATNPSVEGEATALYLARLIRPIGVKVTKLAYGIPMGGKLEFSDRQTIQKALEYRMEVGEQ